LNKSEKLVQKSIEWKEVLKYKSGPKADQFIRISDKESSCRKWNDGFFYCEWTHCD
jgi:hypothetical protein